MQNTLKCGGGRGGKSILFVTRLNLQVTKLCVYQTGNITNDRADQQDLGLKTSRRPRSRRSPQDMCITPEAGSTQCVVHIRGASCVNVSKRFVQSDTYSLLWCVNLPPNWRTRCEEWTNDTSIQSRHIFSYTQCANHDASRIRTTHRVDPAIVGRD